MKSTLKKLYSMPVFMLTLWLTGTFIRIPLLASLLRSMVATMARLVLWTWGEKKKENIVEISRSWTDLMPRPRSKFPIIEIKDGIAIGEIHVHCPLRGTGNSLACFNLMEFDRTIVAGLGGDLTVTNTQSTSGLGYCTVAIKAKDAEWKNTKSAWPAVY